MTNSSFSVGLKPPGTRRVRLDSPLPLGTAIYDADIDHRASRVALELMDSLPAMEAHEERIMEILGRALAEQDRASRVDEVLRRFSPSVQQTARRLAKSNL